MFLYIFTLLSADLLTWGERRSITYNFDKRIPDEEFWRKPLLTG